MLNIHRKGAFLAPFISGLGLFVLSSEALAQGAPSLSEGNTAWLLTSTVVWAGGLSWVILKVVGAVVGLRVSDEDEVEGLDITTHGERGYEI